MFQITNQTRFANMKDQWFFSRPIKISWYSLDCSFTAWHLQEWFTIKLEKNLGDRFVYWTARFTIASSQSVLRIDKCCHFALLMRHVPVFAVYRSLTVSHTKRIWIWTPNLPKFVGGPKLGQAGHCHSQHRRDCSDLGKLELATGLDVPILDRQVLF